jgi:hypothetical protein
MESVTADCGSLTHHSLHKILATHGKLIEQLGDHVLDYTAQDEWEN